LDGEGGRSDQRIVSRGFALDEFFHGTGIWRTSGQKDPEDAVSLTMFSAYGQAMSWFASAVKTAPTLSVY